MRSGSFSPFIFSTLALLSSLANGDGGVVIIEDSPPGVGNYSDFYSDVETAKKIFAGWNQKILVSSGPSAPSELNAMAQNPDLSFIYDSDGKPVLRHIDVPGADPADLNHVQTSIGEMATSLPEDQPLAAYVTGHGGPGETLLAGKERLTIDRLKGIASAKPANRKMIFVFDTCYSASMFPAIIGTKNACALAAAGPDEMSSSGTNLINSVRNTPNAKFADLVHNLRFNDQAYSLPLATSDYFLQQYLSQQTASEDKKETPCTCVPRKSVDSIQDSTSLALIHAESQRLQQDAKVAMKDLKLHLRNRLERLLHLNPHYSYADVESWAQDYGKSISKINAESKDIGTAAGNSYKDYIKAQLGPQNWQKWNDLEDKLDQLHEKLENTSDPVMQKQLQNEIKSVSDQNKPYSDQIRDRGLTYNFGKVGSPAKDKINSFIDAQHPDFICPQDIKDYGKLKNNSLSDCQRTSGELLDGWVNLSRDSRRVSLALQESQSLQMMADNHDFKAMSKYLELLDCENTPLSAVKKGP